MSTFRRAVAADISHIVQIHREAFFAAMPHMPVLHTPAEDLAFYHGHIFPHSAIWLAEENGHIAGFIAFRPGWIEQCYIAPSAQRRGLGTHLLRLAQAAHPSLQLWTFQCNHPARRFYEKHGFHAVQFTDGSNNEERQPDVLYTWTK